MAQAIFLFVVQIIGPLAVKVLVALGIGFTTYTGVDAGLDYVHSWIQGQFAGMPAAMSQIIALLRLDVAISIIIAAYAARIALISVNGVLTNLTLGRSGNSVGI